MGRTKVDTKESLEAGISKRYKWPKTLEEALKMAEEGVKQLPGKLDMNALRKFFKKHPEVFIVDENYKYIVDKYKLETGPRNYRLKKYGDQMGRFYELLNLMVDTAKDVIYKHFTEIKEDASVEESVKDGEVKNSKRSDLSFRQKGFGRKLSLRIKNDFANDKTPIGEFLPKGNQHKVRAYFEKRRVKTLGDFFENCRDNNFVSNVRKFLGSSYDEFYQNIFAYVDVCREDSQAVQKKRKSTVDLLIKLQERPCEDFEKGSISMEEISKEFDSYANRELRPYVNDTSSISNEEVDDLARELVEEFHGIVDKKREELAEKQKKVAGRKASVSGIIGDGAKYHHTPFNQVNQGLGVEPGVHKHHGGDREL